MKNCRRCNKEIIKNNYCSKCYTLNFREKNPGRMEQLCANYYNNNKDKIINRSKKYNKENIDRQAQNHAKWIKSSNYENNRYKKDIQYKLIKIQRARINAAIKGLNKSRTTKELLGCSIEEFKTYIESLFKPGMSWDNYGRFGWHIDHIKPISRFNLEEASQLQEACNYKNLQPMWWQDNLKKGGLVKDKNIIYLLIGAPGSGKSWVAQQLLDKFTYVSYDKNKKDTHLELLQRKTEKHKLYDITFGISTFFNKYHKLFDIRLIAIYENEAVLRSRIELRKGKWTETIIKRNFEIKKRFEKFKNLNSFVGTSNECLSFLKNI